MIDHDIDVESITDRAKRHGYIWPNYRLLNHGESRILIADRYEMSSTVIINRGENEYIVLVSNIGSITTESVNGAIKDMSDLFNNFTKNIDDTQRMYEPDEFSVQILTEKQDTELTNLRALKRKDDYFFTSPEFLRFSYLRKIFKTIR